MPCPVGNWKWRSRPREKSPDEFSSGVAFDGTPAILKKRLTPSGKKLYTELYFKNQAHKVGFP